MSERNSNPIFLDRKPGLYLKVTASKGRGLFCTADIKQGEELETTPAIILNETEHRRAEKTLLHDYVFGVEELSKKGKMKRGVRKIEDASCVVMGIASYANHDEKPNAEVVWEERDGDLYYSLQATRDIPAGTEICTSYGESWFEDRKAEEASSARMAA